MSRWQELEALWFQNGGNKIEVEQSFASRAPGNGIQFLLLLHALHISTEDKRFADAMQAVLDHEIIEEKNGYLRNFKKKWKSIQQRRLEDYTCVTIDDLTRVGSSVREACALMAAHSPVHSASFSSAVKKLTNLYADWLAHDGPSRCAHLYALPSEVGKNPAPKNSNAH